MLSINIADVINVIQSIKSYLIIIGILIIAALIVIIAVRKMKKSKKNLIRGCSLIAMITGICLVVNLICTGPMSTMLDLVSGGDG